MIAFYSCENKSTWVLREREREREREMADERRVDFVRENVRVRRLLPNSSR